ncbi:glucuronoxylan 4-O-methyltransferase 3-like [Canna indica]|uniref:Glucuronoxylan 4-O-methyltransferase 3-like n=1 Tax=Canna indica TaxID=4628 RepID=A0AAQ3K3I4_9LILI|nr:glucuronoxylan 4-O-methyltransferase 3-like [Canna indica]
MKPKGSKSSNSKFIFLGFVLVFLVLLLLSSTYSSSKSSSSSSSSPSLLLSAAQTPPNSCTKIPPSLSEAIINYATSNITPQQTFQEISVTSRVLARRSPCNFLIFGLGHDSVMWSALNHGGRTVFFEEDESWIKSVTGKFPNLESYHVKYDTKLSQADDLMKTGMDSRECKEVVDVKLSGCRLALTKLPKVFYEVEWDLIMVDAPTGYFLDAPGRMSAIYTAGMVARGRRAEGETDVFVHDVNRAVENKFSRAFLCEGYLKEQEGRIRHFTIPSHRGNPGIPFCP